MFAAVYDEATRPCSAGARPGAVALRDGVLEQPRFSALADLGIFNCRDVAGEGVPSVHGNGRAWDASVAPGSLGWLQGGFLAEDLIRLRFQLGIQHVIWDRRAWSTLQPFWRPYGGDNPHTSHLHIELTLAAGERLTIDEVRYALAGQHQEDDMAIPQVIWYRGPDGGSHAYQLLGLHGKHLSRPALDLARMAGVAEPARSSAGGSANPLPNVWSRTAILVDGPCRSV